MQFPLAQFNLAKAYEQGKGVPQDDAQAMLWLKRAADNGYKPAMRYLSQVYTRGLLGQRVSADAARQWSDKAR
jgi:TPR repeat protein